MQSVTFRLAEFFILFIVFPVSLAIPYPLWMKLALGILGFLYVIYILLRVERKRFKIMPHLNWRLFWKRTFIKWIVIAFATIIFMWFTDKINLFSVMTNKPFMWMLILFIYSAFSVYPQEIIYRTFYFQRYQSLFKNEKLFIFLNAIVFSLAHLFFRNALVMGITFIGGILFALTFKRTKSTLLVTVEHAIYGCWLYTVGMGSMLGFPS